MAQYKDHNMTNRISLILKSLMKQKAISSSELARRTGIAQPVIYRIASGETDNPKLNTIIPLAKYFDVSIDHLVYGLATKQHDELKTTDEPKENSKVPLLTWEQIKNKNLFEIHNWYTCHSKTSKHAFSVIIKNDAFLPNFPPETIMIFDPEKIPTNKDIILAIYKNEATIKEYLVDGGDTYLKPIRHELNARLLDEKDNLEVLGVLVETTSFYKGNSYSKE